LSSLLNSRSLNPDNPDRRDILQLLKTDFKNATYLYPFRSQVAEHNDRKIRELAAAQRIPLKIIKAKDEIPSGKKTAISKDPDRTGGLLQELQLVEGCEVMLRHNLDVSDGLHNGARGVIAQIGEPEPVNASANIRPVTRNSIGEPKILPSVPTVYIHFHNPGVGQKADGIEIQGKKAIKINPVTISFNTDDNTGEKDTAP